MKGQDKGLTSATGANRCRLCGVAGEGGVCSVGSELAHIAIR